MIDASTRSQALECGDTNCRTPTDTSCQPSGDKGKRPTKGMYGSNKKTRATECSVTGMSTFDICSLRPFRCISASKCFVNAVVRPQIFTEKNTHTEKGSLAKGIQVSNNISIHNTF